MADLESTQKSPMDMAQSLLREKDAIEAQIRTTEMELQAHNISPNEQLIDAEGFPRADIDLVAITALRAKLAKLRNDLKFMMPRIEEALYKVHEAARKEKDAARQPAQEAPAENAEDALQAFARVNAVAPDSPAWEGGLIRGDQIVQFGLINATNHNNLKALNDHVVAQQNHPIVVKVLRAKDDGGEETLALFVTPRLGWGGRGLLGYTDMPMQPIAEGIALRDVSAEGENDLMFLKGERVALIKRLSNNFCLGYCEGVYGRFQASDVAFAEMTKGQEDLLAHTDNKSRSVLALADRGQQQDASAPSHEPPQSQVANMQQPEPHQQKQELLEPNLEKTKALGQTSQGHMQLRRQPSLPRRMKSDENLGTKPEPPASSRRKVLSSVPIHFPKSMAAAMALTPPTIPPRSSSRNSNSRPTSPGIPHPAQFPPSTSQSLSPLLPPPPITVHRESGSLALSQSVPRLTTTRPDRLTRPASKRSSTSDSGYQQGPNLNQSSISIADYASEGTEDEEDDEADDEELDKLDTEHTAHDRKASAHNPQEEHQQQRTNRGSTSMVDQLRAKTKNAFQRVGFSLAPNARLFSDHAGKDIDLKVTRISTYSSVANGSSVISIPQQLASAPQSTSGHLVPIAPSGAAGGEAGSSRSGRVRQRSANGNEPEPPTFKDNISPRLMQRIRSWSVSNNQRPRPALRDVDAPEVPVLDPKHLSNLSSATRPGDSSDDQKQEHGQNHQKPQQQHLQQEQPQPLPSSPPPPQQQQQQTSQQEPQSQSRPTDKPRRDPSWLSPPTGTAKGKALAEGRPYSLGQGIAGGRADFGGRSGSLEDNSSATTNASDRIATATSPTTTGNEAPTPAEGADEADGTEEANKVEQKILSDQQGEQPQDQPVDLVVDDYGFIVDTSDDHADAASAINGGGTASIMSSHSLGTNGNGNGGGRSGGSSSANGHHEDSSWFPTSMWPEKRDEARRAARVRNNERKWIQLMSFKHPAKVKKLTRFKKLVREGIPPSLRGRVWLYLANADMYRQPGLFEELIHRESIPIHEVIERDIHRCYPDHVHFRSDQGDGQRDLRNVLRAYAHYKPQVGYCQGMGRLVGMMLMQMLAEDAFWLLVATIEGYLQNYYTPNLLQLRIDANVFDLLLKEHDPVMREHLAKNDIIPVLYMTPWFLTLFTMSLPWASVLRVWDIFYFDGTRALFRVGLGILHISRDHLLNNCPTSSELLAYILHIPMEILSPKSLLDATFRSRLHQSTLDRLTVTASQTVKEEEAAKMKPKE
ncbi:hypothetical protein DFQ26_002859 [Actinomortierella ambigua]|nr:hypothetical protein DFQ26_002859 [Actinomortierella ambigua]